MSTEPIQRLRSLFVERSARSGDEPSWLSLTRRNALERFLERGFPTTRDEDWRFTSTSSLEDTDFALPALAKKGDAEDLVEQNRFADGECHELVFVNGHVSPELCRVGSLANGMVATSLSRAVLDHADRVQPLLASLNGDGTSFADLNEAFLSDGAFIYVPKGEVLDRPIHLVFVTTGASQSVMTHPRNLIIAGERSEMRIVETYAGVDGAAYWTNTVTSISAGEGSVVDHYKLQREGDRAFHLASLDSVQSASSTLSNHSLSLGAKLARHDIRTTLDGRGADLTLNGLYVVRGTQHVDHHTTIDHKVAHCTSRELYKGVLDDGSSGVFNGRVIVRPDAQKTDSRQSNKNLLLSADALVNTNPQLEINADDVRCAHGATIGQLDEDMVFYLRSRGIGLEQARTMLTQGFMADVSERIRVAPVKRAVNRRLFAEPAA